MPQAPRVRLCAEWWTPAQGRGDRGVGVAILRLAISLAAAPAAAQTVTTSPGPDTVAVTIYRDPDRPAERALNLQWLNGYALITETRRVAIPLGEGTIRFEGVAGGILPQSAIVTGLPDGVIEKNQDAQLLSPGSLLDASLGRRVHLRRTSRETGAVREQEAVVRTGNDGAVVLQTAGGFEALRCSGLAETIVYDAVPEGLSAKPTLSVRTRGGTGGAATITLSYLASGFDWQANYVANLNPAGDRVDLFAWVTLANGDETGFREAATQTVAGRPNREGVDRRVPPEAPPLRLTCWPSDRTSDIVDPPPPAPPPPPTIAMGEEIVVTGMRQRAANLESSAPVMVATQEELGDLKLYRIPEPVTVAANSQKQVAMLIRPGVKVSQIYRSEIYGSDEAPETIRILKTRNRTAEGLGAPLPAGGVVLFAGGAERPILIGEGSIADRAVGEDVEVKFGEAPGVVARLTKGEENRFELAVTNDQPRPIAYEAVFSVQPTGPSQRLIRRDGRSVWAVKVPANGRAVLRYGVKRESPSR